MAKYMLVIVSRTIVFVGGQRLPAEPVAWEKPLEKAYGKEVKQGGRVGAPRRGKGKALP